jgi:hypothetical protein
VKIVISDVKFRVFTCDLFILYVELEHFAREAFSHVKFVLNIFQLIKHIIIGLLSVKSGMQI